MKILMIVIFVTNGRFYHETPVYATEYPTEAACLAKAGTYPTKGISYYKAVCVPKVQG